MDETRKVLVTGASIAGPALAYWLERYGLAVTLVERASTIRTGGYAIDVRGSAVDVLDRMGILPAVRAQHRVGSGRVTWLNAKGREVARLNVERLMSGGGDRHVGLARGDLTSHLFELVRENVTCRFGDAIIGLDDGRAGAEVQFKSGAGERFDLVVCGEGLHSTTRALIFGPEQTFSRYLGYCFAIFELPNEYGLRHETVVYNGPGKAVALFPAADERTLFGIFVHRRPAPTQTEVDDPQLQRDSIARAFAEDCWLVPDLIVAMKNAADLYFDAAMQIRMPSWSRGRVAVLGDAAFGPSFFTGQGTSMALVGAYMMAQALASHSDHALAFQVYEAATRPYIEANQALAKEGSTMVAPGNAWALWWRNAMFRMVPLLGRLGVVGQTTRAAYEALTLPGIADARPVTNHSSTRGKSPEAGSVASR